MNGLLRRLMELPSRRRNMPELKTRRLRLVAMQPEMLEADAARDGTLASLLAAKVPSEWPPSEWETHVLASIFAESTGTPASLGWRRYTLLIEADGSRTLMGCVGGFAKADGEIEMGYSTLPSYQRLGYGTEAASALIEWLLRQKGVRSVTAQTHAETAESIKVMQRCGMVFAGVGDDPGTVRYRRER